MYFLYVPMCGFEQPMSLIFVYDFDLLVDDVSYYNSSIRHMLWYEAWTVEERATDQKKQTWKLKFLYSGKKSFPKGYPVWDRHIARAYRL